jgi:hypothetical protein
VLRYSTHSSVNMSPEDADVGKIISKDPHAWRVHPCLGSLHSIPFGPLLVVALFSNHRSHGDSWNENGWSCVGEPLSFEGIHTENFALYYYMLCY